ncbi:hypothetical protein [Brachyspira hyodysenteriae]|nr:hypothetical protein [Brachyspira hyodysenteriae]MCZ9838465.1 hypothetical protein [Brachyspira hyodysenteriae]MCZ9847469.1 hypothetical protein [Brachyspira hyodysenteriae]MCZ9874219.1 hypothetical protein [Brachyspira hyodysenteriae]MCZ9886299.1 hypothetical protein [Brachyspira hyodysenteriae]MCZ9929172.1 hypothetical protein [Brachyspira hyodysenteriae]
MEDEHYEYYNNITTNYFTIPLGINHFNSLLKDKRRLNIIIYFIIL